MRTLIISLILLIVPARPLHAQAQVYLVLGSDTGIWDGADVGTYHCYYRQDLYTNPGRNAHKVMDPSFRQEISDSYGQVLKLTWWMHGGNMFRNAANNNFPLNNTMALYLMKKYHGDAIQRFGDELTLHYHTWRWTDYDGDGRYWWNQTKQFEECREDFDVTLAQYLLEENVFPVSFRSGWHYMDNGWQQYLDELLPFSLHNDYPYQRTDDSEPLDNSFDWSQAPADFVPYHPSRQNYQVPGDGKGWNVRSKFMGNVDQPLMNQIFAQAAKGIDQVACLWAHLPEADFLDNIQKIDRLAHNAAANYPGVKFHYLTAVEAMRAWLRTTDTALPQLLVEEKLAAGQVAFVIRSNETIFQRQPFVAAKDIDERYFIVNCQSTGMNEWRTYPDLAVAQLAKIGFAVTDTVGNLSTQIIRYLPDEVYIDNLDDGYQELAGSWRTTEPAAWGVNARLTVLSANDSARVRWTPQLADACEYSLFFQMPPLNNLVDSLRFHLYQNGNRIATALLAGPFPANEWLHVITLWLDPAGDPYFEMTATGDNAGEKVLVADVLKISALIPDYRMELFPHFLDFGEVSLYDSATANLLIKNFGREKLTIYSVYSKTNNLKTPLDTPFEIAPFQKQEIPVMFVAEHLGLVQDSLIIATDNPLKPEMKVPYTAHVKDYFVIVDNEDQNAYREHGNWHYSVAQAYGPTSRYVYLTEGKGSYAEFTVRLKQSGMYEIFEIVPRTVNSTDHALYVILVDNAPQDSVYIDQNAGSGNWVSLGLFSLPADKPVSVRVINNGGYTKGEVLRADAIKFQSVRETTVLPENAEQNALFTHKLFQNYPNPFNPATTIVYQIPHAGQVSLKVYDVMGREVATLVDAHQQQGRYTVRFNASNLSSGMYVLLMESGGFRQSYKMILLR